MLREEPRAEQVGYELVLIEELVPKDHLLRKIAKVVSFIFIYDLCKDLYSADMGRPAVSPVMLFKMLLIGYLFGIKSETRLVEEIECNVAYRWFLGLGLTDKVPNHATISINRVRRFRDNKIAEKIFNEILRQAQEAGLVGGAIIYTDSTHIKAKANKHKKVLVEVEQTPKSYLQELDEQIDRDRAVLGKAAFERDEAAEPKRVTKMMSTTDPQSGQLNQEGKPDGFHYREHRSVDSKYNIIVNSYVTAGNVNDSTVLPQVIEGLVGRLGQAPKYMGLDAGYHSAPVAWLLNKWGIQGVIGYKRYRSQTDNFKKWQFTYDFDQDVYWCPEKKPLYWRTTDRDGYRLYYSDSKVCKECPRRGECMSEKSTRREVTRHVWQDWLDKTMAFTRTENGQRLYRWRKETIEPSFAESKENHGLRTARMVGLANVDEQCFLTDTAQNIKKMAKLLWPLALFFRLPYMWIWQSIEKRLFQEKRATLLMG